MIVLLKLKTLSLDYIKSWNRVEHTQLLFIQ
nr:MAG TPA: hypothetical protein [Bacteriophage sp.]